MSPSKRRRKELYREHRQSLYDPWHQLQITKWTLGRRDKWVCGLCGLPIVRHKREGSIDHIVPIALGGRHTWENVRIAHRACNTASGNMLALWLKGFAIRTEAMLPELAHAWMHRDDVPATQTA